MKLKQSDVRTFRECERKFWLDNSGYKSSEEDELSRLKRKQSGRHTDRIRRFLEEKTRELCVDAWICPEQTRVFLSEKRNLIYRPAFVLEGDMLVTPKFLIYSAESGKYTVALCWNRNFKEEIEDKDRQNELFLTAKAMEGYDDISGRIEVYFKNYLSKLFGVGDLPKNFSEKLPSDIISDMRECVASADVPEAYYAFSRCAGCSYHDFCLPKFEEKQDLTLLPNIDGRSLRDGKSPGFLSRGIDTISRLAELKDPCYIADVPYVGGTEKAKLIVEQARCYTDDTFCKRRDDFALSDGAYIYFDIENGEHADTNEDYVYLWGFLLPPYGKSDFRYVWVEPGEDESGWDEFLRLIGDLGEEYPDLRLIHFGNHEKNKVREYDRKYGAGRNEFALRLLNERDGVMTDLLKITREAVILPIRSYGIKEICKHAKLVNFQWSNPDSGSAWSMIEFDKYQEIRNNADMSEPEKNAEREKIKNLIIEYNRDDVLAMRALAEWLEKIFKK